MTLFEKITQSPDALVEWLIHGVSKTNPAIPAALIGCTTAAVSGRCAAGGLRGGDLHLQRHVHGGDVDEPAAVPGLWTAAAEIHPRPSAEKLCCHTGR